MTRGDRRVLLMRIGALGDVLLMRRLTFSLALEGCRTTLLAPARHARVLAADPWIDRILDSESAAFGSAFAGSWPDAGPRDFDAAVVLSRSPELEKAATEAAPQVWVVPPEPGREDESIALQFAKATRPLAAPFLGELPPLPTDARLAVSRDAVILHAGSGSKRKNWPIDRFVALGRTLAREGFKVIWTKGPADEEPPVGAHDFEILESPPLVVLAATLATARAFVGNDSGVSHLAAAVGAPTLALFGPTRDAVWRPDGAFARTMRAPEGKLERLEVASVMAAVRALPGFGPGETSD